MKSLLLALLGLLLYFIDHNSFVDGQSPIIREARWCAINDKEHAKCEGLRQAIKKRDEITPPQVKHPILSCVGGANKQDCLMMINSNQADMLTLDSGMGYMAGEFFTMMPIMAERYSSDKEKGIQFHSVGVVRKDNREIDFADLRGKKTCHTGVGRSAGWIYPISTMMEKDVFDVKECNVHVKTAAEHLGIMCAPGALTRFYNPFGNNPVKVCELCSGRNEDRCTANDPFADYAGAFECMASKAGDIAFIKETTVQRVTDNSTKYNSGEFELLCPEPGKRAALGDFANCNWGVVPSHIVMTSAMRDEDTRKAYKAFLEDISNSFGKNGIHNQMFEVFESIQYGGHNLMFTDDTKELVDVGEKDSYYTWAGPEFRRRQTILNRCPVRQARWCVISTWEMKKCEEMIMAFSAKSLKPDLTCILGESTRDCMVKIKNGDADLITLDASDVYIAGKHFDLVPIAAEDYSGYDDAKYYAVGIAKKRDSHLTIFNLKARRSCHGGAGTAAGWSKAVDKLIETGQVRVSNCDLVSSVAEFFSKSCVPGILEKSFNPKNQNPINLCEACGSGGLDRCRRTSDELYFGNSGAFRCLVEGSGNVAFAKHTTVRENTGGRNPSYWARNRRSDDYELLCNDGTRAAIDDWQGCNYGEIPGNAVVTAGFKSQQIRDIYWTLMNYAQQFFAADSNSDFPMFDSMLDHNDLIFQDSTMRLIKVFPERQNYQTYLGSDFMRLMRRLDEWNCNDVSAQTAGSSNLFNQRLFYYVQLVSLAVTMVFML